MLTPRLLYVDDDLDNCSVFRHAFRQFTVETCASGREALDILARSSPEIIITDQRMPGMSGIELLERVREIDPTIRRLMITAYDDDETRKHNGAGVCGCIEKHFTKPFDIIEVEAAIRALPSLTDLADRVERVMRSTAHTFDAIFAEDERRRQETQEIITPVVERIVST